jgi:hypothetical protein
MEVSGHSARNRGHAASDRAGTDIEPDVRSIRTEFGRTPVASVATKRAETIADDERVPSSTAIR